MALITLTYVFSAGTTIVASQHNTNFSTIYSDYNGNITNANIAAGAGIVASKLVLTSPGAIGSGSPNTGAFTTLSSTGLASLNSLLVGSVHQGDVLYDNGTSLVRLTPGTSGTPLVTQGASANPQYTTLSSTGVSGVFGAWNNCSGSTCANSTVYLATTDLLYLFCYSGNPSPQLTAYTDSSNPPTTVRLQPLSQATSSNETVCGTLPVRKGDYYKTTGQYAASFSFGYTIPIGS